MNYSDWLQNLLQTVCGWSAAGEVEMRRFHIRPPAERGEVVEYLKSAQIPVIDELVDFYTQATSECDVGFYRPFQREISELYPTNFSGGFRIDHFRDMPSMKETLLDHLSYVPNYDESDKRKIDAIAEFSWPFMRFPTGALIFYMQPNALYSGGYYGISVETLQNEEMPYKYCDKLSELLTFSEKSCYTRLEPDELIFWMTPGGLKDDEKWANTVRATFEGRDH